MREFGALGEVVALGRGSESFLDWVVGKMAILWVQDIAPNLCNDQHFQDLSRSWRVLLSTGDPEPLRVVISEMRGTL